MKQPIPMIYKPNKTCDDTLLPPGRFAIVWVTGEIHGRGYLGRINEAGAIADLERDWIYGGNYFSESKTMPYTAEAWEACQAYNRQANEIVAAYETTFDKLKKKAKNNTGQLEMKL